MLYGIVLKSYSFRITPQLPHSCHTVTPQLTFPCALPNKYPYKLPYKSVSVLAFLFVCAVSVILSSCSDELDIQQSYPFKVETMPVPKDIVRGQTVEIRCELKAEGKFDGTIYTIRYFQHDGKGSLRMENGTVFQPNDRYLLENEKFRLYYTSASTETQTLTVVVEDNFGKSYEMEFSFNDTDDEEEFARSANKLGSV